MVKVVDSATPIEVKDVVASEAFYREKLGFNAGKFFGEPPTFCIVWRDQVEARQPPVNPFAVSGGSRRYVELDE
jgi:catechol 2,3-dioxygenase-like lactoylglutathione lyase family enzyme